MKDLIPNCFLATGRWPHLVTLNYYKNNNINVTYDSDMQYSHVTLKIEDFKKNFEMFTSGMIVWCPNGQSRFCLNNKSGYYRVWAFPPKLSFDSTFLGKTIPGSSQKEFEKALKLKVFW